MRAAGSRSFTYDGFGRRVRVLEKDASGTVTADRRFVWAGYSIAQERDATGTVVKKFFGAGQQRLVLGSWRTFLYARDHLGSIREVIRAAALLLFVPFTCVSWSFWLWVPFLAAEPGAAAPGTHRALALWFLRRIGRVARCRVIPEKGG